jgi:hypothetical protein
MDTIFSSYFKIQVSKINVYRNINQKVAPAAIRFVERRGKKPSSKSILIAGHLCLGFTVLPSCIAKYVPAIANKILSDSRERVKWEHCQGNPDIKGYTTINIAVNYDGT